MVAHGALSVGAFVTFNLYLAMLVMPLRSLGMWIGQAQRATASGERIFQVLDEPEEIADRPAAIELPAGDGASASRTSRSPTSPGGRCSRTSTWRSTAGRTVALIGHTGSGKTTLTSLVPRFYDATAGRVTVDGVDVRDVTLVSLRRAIGVISQDPFLFSATVRDNIAFGAADAERRGGRARSRALAQAHEFIERLPQGYDTVIGERGITLSGGQRQRIAIARALAVDPRILILDDATASVDATTEAQIRRRAARGDGGPDDADHRPPALDDRARRRDRRARQRPHRGARHARRAARDQPGLPRDLRARPARARSSPSLEATRAEPRRRDRERPIALGTVVDSHRSTGARISEAPTPIARDEGSQAGAAT